MGKKGKRGIALVLCFLWITAMPVFAAGTEQPSGEKDGQETAVVLPEEPEENPENRVPDEEEVPDENVPETGVPEAGDIPEGNEVPEEAEAPEEADVPEENDIPKEAKALEEAEVPEEVDLPEENEIPEEADVPEKADVPEENEVPEDGVHILLCGADCNGEDCICPCHETAEELELGLSERLLAAQSCQALFGLMQEKQEGLLSLTAQELTALQNHAASLPDDGWQGDVLEILEMLLARLEAPVDEPKAYATATIHNVPRNAVVAYAYRTAGDGGWTWGGEYTGDFDITYSPSFGIQEEFYVFFVKPAENHLLTRFSVVNESSGSTSFDLYSIDCTTSRISAYPDFGDLVAQAKAMGYLGFNGYRGAAAGNMTLNQYFTGQKPALNVAATAEPSEGVKPGDQVTFTVTLTPETVAGSTVKDFQLERLTVNGTVYNAVSLRANGDGTYTAVVKYTAGASDWNAGNITLNAEANITYEYILPVTDRDNNGSRIITTSTVASAGTAEVSLAPPTATLTVRKLVTGNLGDRNREFTFRLTGGTLDGTGETEFRLKHGETKTFTVNRGDTVTVWEDCGDYEASYRLGTEETAGNKVTFSVTEDGEIVFYNRKEIPLDTGVSLEWAPYVWLLILASAAACAQVRRRS